jgi:hypothetical protein
MSNTDFRPKAGDFGEQHIALSRVMPTAAFTAANVLRHYLPMVASEITVSSMTEMLYYKGGALVFGGVAPVVSVSVTARIVKRNSGGTITPISGNATIVTAQAVGSVLTFPILATATDNERTTAMRCWWSSRRPAARCPRSPRNCIVP